ncbi:cytochrome P450 [Lyophyllum atratum]|nr:cytochrome P450 [Lyophyllum atratum]
MSALILPSFLVFCVLWILVALFRRFVAKNDLDNIGGPPSGSFLKGNFGQLYNIHGFDFHIRIAEQFGRVIKIFGPFGSRQLYIFDPKAVHHILVKDQYIFEETTAFLASNGIVFGDGLLASLGQLGDKHRKQRKLINPVFSVAHMRNMVPIFEEVAKKLSAAIQLNIDRGAQEVDILHWMTRAALEMIGLCGLGCSFDPLTEGAVAHPFSKAAKELVPVLFTFEFTREFLLPLLVKIGSPRFRKYAVDLLAIPWKNLRSLKKLVNIMDDTTTQIFEEKKRAMESGAAESKDAPPAKDILSILMRANMEAAEEDRLPDQEVLGQLSTFTFAGTDTTSNAFARILHLLSTYPDAQERLRKEIIEARDTHGDVPYDALVALPFMDAVCRETMRLYPPVSTVIRTTRQDVVLPLSTPVKGLDGSDISSIFIKNNTNIVVSILCANQDPTLWGPDAAEWKPERWLAPLPQALIDAHMPGVYSHTLTFLGGGRACIGFKFSELELKVVLSVLLSQFRFSLSEKEILWEMGGIVTPSVKGLPRQPQMPLKVESIGTNSV